MLLYRRGTPRWADDSVSRRNGRCRRTGKEADFPLEGSLMMGGSDWGDVNNSFVSIIERD